MKIEGRRQSTNVVDRRNPDALTKLSDAAAGGLAGMFAGAKLAAQDLTNTGPYDNRTLGDVYKDFVNRTSDQTNHKLK